MEQDSHWQVTSSPVLALTFSGMQCTGRWSKVKAASGVCVAVADTAWASEPTAGSQVYHRLLDTEGCDEDVDLDNDEDEADGQVIKVNLVRLAELLRLY